MNILQVKFNSVLSLSLFRVKHPLPQAMKYTVQSSDQELVAGCLKNDRLAQKYLYERFSVKMLNITMRYTKDKVEAVGLMNTAFLQVFNSLGKYEERGSLSGWIATIVLRAAIRHAKSNATYHQVMDFESTREAPIENEALLQIEMEAVYSHLQQLPVATRTVFSMYVLDGFKHREIAEELQISIGTSKWHLAHGRKILQNCTSLQKPLK